MFFKKVSTSIWQYKWEYFLNTLEIYFYHNLQSLLWLEMCICKSQSFWHDGVFDWASKCVTEIIEKNF